MHQFFKSELHLIQCLCFLTLFLDMVDMYISLSTEKFPGIQHLALVLLQTKPVTVYQAMSFRQGQLFASVNAQHHLFVM